MFAHTFRLESLKQRSLFLSLALVFAATLLMSFLRQLVARADIMEGIAGIFFLLAVAGIPFLAAALPSAAGASLRQKNTRLIEEALPFHPQKHFLAAYLVSLVHFLFLSGTILLGVVFTGGFSASSSLHDNELLLLIALFQVHIFAFSISYISKQPVIGGISAIAICLLQLSFYFEYGPSVIPTIGSWNWFLRHEEVLIWDLIATVPAALFLFFVMFLSSRFERENTPHASALFGLLLLLFAGPLISFSYINFSAYRLQTRLEPAFRFSFILNLDTNLKQGVILQTPTGNLLRVTSNHERRILSRNYENADATYGPDGSVWVLTKSNDSYAIRVQRNGTMQDFTTFSSASIIPDRIMVVDSNPFVFGRDAEYNRYFANVSPRKQPDWKKAKGASGYEALEYLAQKGEAAELSADRRTLLRKLPDGTMQKWLLPGEGNDVLPLHLSFYPAAFRTNAGPGFVLSVKTEDKGTRIIRCFPDGRVDEPWPIAQTSQSVTLQKLSNNGSLLREFEPRNFFVMDQNGNAYPPFNLSIFAKDDYPRARKLEGDNLWIVSRTKFIRANLKNGSKHVLAEIHPQSQFSLDSTSEGIYFVLNRKIWLLDWDGKSHLIGSAEMD